MGEFLRDRLQIAGVWTHFQLPLFRNAYALMLSSGTTSALGFAYWVLAAHYYSPSVLGWNSAIISAMLFLAGVAQLSMNNVLVRFIPIAGKATLRLVIYTYLATLVAASLVGLLFLLGVDTWSPTLKVINSTPVWALSFIGAVMTWCVFSLQDSVFTGLRQTFWVPIENSIFAVAKIVLLVAVASTLQRLGIYVSWSITAALTLIPVNLLIFRRLIPSYMAVSHAETSPIRARQILNFASGNYLGTLFALASSLLLPILVANRAGAMANSYFYLAWTIAVGLQLVASNLAISLTVEASADRGQTAAYARLVLGQAARLLLPAVLVVFLGAPWILLAFGKFYAEQGTVALRLLALGTIPNVLVNLSLGLARIQNRALLIMLIQGALCVLILGLSALWLPVFGVNGVAFAWMSSQTIVAVILVFTELRGLLFSKGIAWSETL